jgi:tubulin beta
MNYIIEECDNSIIIDNEALYNIAQHSMKQKEISFSFINKICKRVMLESTSSLRFGGFNNAGVRKLNTNLCPFPRLHFLTTTLAPLSNMVDNSYDVMGAKELTRELFDSKNAICMAELSKGKLLAGAAIYRGKVETSAAESALASVKDKQSANFVEWIPDNLLSSICHVPNKDYAMSAVMLGNNTSIQNIFKRLEGQFEPMLRKKAFMHHYLQQGLDWSEMTEAQGNMNDLISEYQQYEAGKADEMYEGDSDDEYEPFQKTTKSCADHSDNHSTHGSSHID